MKGAADKIPFEWDMECGRVILLQKDKEPLFEAVAQYCVKFGVPEKCQGFLFFLDIFLEAGFHPIEGGRTNLVSEASMDRFQAEF